MKYVLITIALFLCCIVPDDSYASEDGIQLANYDDLIVQTYKYKPVTYMECHYAGLIMRSEGIMDKVVEIYIGHPAVINEFYKKSMKVLGKDHYNDVMWLRTRGDIYDAMNVMNNRKCKEPAQYAVRQIYGK